MVLQGAWLTFGYSDRPGKSRAGGGTQQNTARGGFARLSPTEPGDTGVPPSLLHCSGQLYCRQRHTDPKDPWVSDHLSVSCHVFWFL